MQNLLIPKYDLNATVDLKEFRFDLGKSDYDQTVCLSSRDNIIGTLGSLVVVTGKPKARKTTFLHAILAGLILSESIFYLRGSLPQAKSKVVLIDTEQSKYELYHSLRRLALHTGRPLGQVPNFDVFSARSLDCEQIKNLIETICQTNPNVGVVAIDGLIDLVNDINDVREAKAAVTFIKRILDIYNVVIIAVLHQNKGTNFSLGHLGSFASRFAQSELSIEKNKDGTSTLEATFLRSANSIEPITIYWDEYNSRYDTLK
tara:strand:+ start:10667 stop:11446 length:780 start_codon:yes stop_codon:yes gene_type:complete